MIKIFQLFALILIFFTKTAFATETSVPKIEQGYNQYIQSCVGCHDMRMISNNELQTLNFQQTPLPSQPLIIRNNISKQQDLSLFYKQTGYNYEKLRHFFANFSTHPEINYNHDLSEEYLLEFIHWANKPYKKTASTLGFSSIIYLLLMLIIWILWALKLHHRVTRRYDRYDVPNFPDDAPSNLTKASNDP